MLVIHVYQEYGKRTKEKVDEFTFCCWQSLYEWLSRFSKLNKCPKCDKKKEENKSATPILVERHKGKTSGCDYNCALDYICCAVVFTILLIWYYFKRGADGLFLGFLVWTSSFYLGAGFENLMGKRRIAKEQGNNE